MILLSLIDSPIYSLLLVAGLSLLRTIFNLVFKCKHGIKYTLTFPFEILIKGFSKVLHMLKGKH